MLTKDIERIRVNNGVTVHDIVNTELQAAALDARNHGKDIHVKTFIDIVITFGPEEYVVRVGVVIDKIDPVKPGG